MKKIFGLEILGNIDCLFVGVTNREKVNLVGLLILDNFDPKKLSELLIERGIKKIQKLRSKVISFLGNYYWKEVPLDKAIERISIIQNHNIKDDTDIYKFIENDINIFYDTLNELPYEIKIIPYKNSESGAILFKFDHVLSDGLGMVSLMCCLADNYDVNVFPTVMKNFKYRWNEYIINWISFIYYGPKVFYEMFKSEPEKTPFRKIKVEKGQVKISISGDYNISEFSKIRKKLKISLNDILMSSISRALKKLCDKEQNDEYKIEFKKLKSYKCFFPIGKTSIPNSYKDLEINNNAQVAIMSIPLIRDLRSEYFRVGKVFKSTLQNSEYCNAATILAKILVEFAPKDFMNWISDWYMGNIDLVVSNLPGPTSPLYYAGSKVTKMIGFPTVSRFRTFIAISSYDNLFRIVMSVDVDSQIDSRNFIEMIDKQLKKFALE